MTAEELTSIDCALASEDPVSLMDILVGLESLSAGQYFNNQSISSLGT